ncbi:MAG: hypothetical protein QXY96_07405 [Candidatus Methanomethylicaceae archaeon]
MTLVPAPPDKIKYLDPETGKEEIWVICGGRENKLEYMSLGSGLRKLFEYSEAIRYAVRE